MSKAITVTFTDPTYAGRALDELERLHDSRRINLSAAIVAVKDVYGDVTVDAARNYVDVLEEDEAEKPPVVTSPAETADATPSETTGAATLELRITVEQAYEVVNRLPSASSALLFEYFHGTSDVVAAVIRDFEGYPYAVDVTDEADSNLETVLRNAIRP